MRVSTAAEEFLKGPARESQGAHVVGALFILGGFLGGVSLLLPHPDQGEAWIWGVNAVALLTGLLLLAFGDRIGYLMLNVVVAFGATLINAMALASGVAAGVYAGMFCWVVLVSVNFFSLRDALLQFGFMITTFAIVLTAVESSGDYSAISRWLAAALALGVTGAAGAFLVFRRRLAEEESQRFLRLSREMLCTIGSDGHFSNLNPAWENVLGSPVGELYEKPVIDLVHPLDRPATEEAILKLRDGTDSLTMENRLRLDGGGWQTVRWIASFADEESMIYARVEPTAGAGRS